MNCFRARRIGTKQQRYFVDSHTARHGPARFNLSLRTTLASASFPLRRNPICILAVSSKTGPGKPPPGGGGNRPGFPLFLIAPSHPYSAALRAAAFHNSLNRFQSHLPGEIPSPLNRLEGAVFRHVAKGAERFR